jgi:predicted O-methyltransferase YrrM
VSVAIFDDPYASHLPVLRAIGARVPVRSVLEFGCGPHSTLTFLNRVIFPEVERVLSYEADSDWAYTVRQAAWDDARLHLQVLRASVEDTIRQQDLDGYDLIFIDDQKRVEARARTIRAVASRQPKGLVVVHDFEVAAYQKAARGLASGIVFNALQPYTGVLWRGPWERWGPLLDGCLSGVRA